MPTLIRESKPIARKEHKCSWCRGVIPVGEKYERQVLEYDGYLYEWKNHLECSKVAMSLDMFAECNARCSDIPSEGGVREPTQELFSLIRN